MFIDNLTFWMWSYCSSTFLCFYENEFLADLYPKIFGIYFIHPTHFYPYGYPGPFLTKEIEIPRSSRGLTQFKASLSAIKKFLRGGGRQLIIVSSKQKAIVPIVFWKVYGGNNVFKEG